MTSGRLNEKEIREQELKRVCNKLGVKHHIIGGVANQKLFGSKIIAQIIEDFKPNIILMPFILDDNDDHRKTHLQFKAALKKFFLRQIIKENYCLVISDLWTIDC